MKTLGMYDNEGNVALARKLNGILGVMPETLTVDERVMFVKDTLRADTDFCAKHGEWTDTECQNILAWWFENPKKLKISDTAMTVSVGFYFPLEVTTLNDDVHAVFEDRANDIHEIIEDAIQNALQLIEKRVGRIAGEWSGVSLSI